MKAGFVGLISLLISALLFVILFTIIASKLLGSDKNSETSIELENGQTIDTSTRPKEVQKTVDDLQDQLQQKQNESMETEIP